MNSYQILYKNDVVLAVNLSNDNASEEIKSLSEQGFKVFVRIIQAVSEEKAIAIYRAENVSSHSDHELNIKHIFLFKTNRLRRLPYLGYSFVTFVVSVFSIMLVMTMTMSHGQEPLMFLIFPMLLVMFWFGVGLCVARWKNCGHKGWYYPIALVLTMVLDLFLLGFAGMLLWLYLIFNPESNKITMAN